MKKLKVTLTGLVVLCLSIGAVNAQTGTNNSTNSTPAAKKTTPKKSTSKKSTHAKKIAPQTNDTKDAKEATTGKQPTNPTPAQHLKKDGTPDMRYKENKAAAGKTTAKKPAATPATTQPATGN